MSETSTALPEARFRWLRLLLVGLAGGFLSGLFGVGGGIVMVPLLVTVLRVDQRRASAISLAAIIPASVVGTVGYALGHQVAWLPAALIALGGIAGSRIGTALLRRISLPWLRWLFIALLVAAAVRTVVAVPERDGTMVLDWISGPGFVLLGVLMGIASGLFGIGGGVLAVPLLIAVFGAGDLLARGTSLAAMIVTALAGSWANLRAGRLVPVDSAVVGVAGLAASVPGVAVAFLLSPTVATILFVLLVAVSIAQLLVAARRDRRAAASGR